MPEKVDETTEKLKKLFAIVNEDSLTRSEFTSNFEKVVNLILRVEKQNSEAIDRLEKSYNTLSRVVAEKHDMSLSELKKQTNELFVGQQVEKLRQDHTARMKDVEVGMSQIRSGRDGINGINGKDGKNADDRKIFKLLVSRLMKEIERLKEELGERIDKRSKQFGGNVVMTGQNPGSMIKLTATGTIDEANTTFTFAQKPLIIVQNGQMLDEGNGWSWSGADTATLENPVGNGGVLYGIL